MAASEWSHRNDAVRVLGTACDTCHNLLTESDYRTHGNTCSHCVRAGIIERTLDALLVMFGFLACWAFFLGAAFYLCNVWVEADWSAFSRKLAEVSVDELISTALKFGFLFLITSAVLGWALRRPRKRDYRLWGKIAGYALGIAALIYLQFHK